MRPPTRLKNVDRHWGSDAEMVIGSKEGPQEREERGLPKWAGKALSGASGAPGLCGQPWGELALFLPYPQVCKTEGIKQLAGHWRSIFLSPPDSECPLDRGYLARVHLDVGWCICVHVV